MTLQPHVFANGVFASDRPRRRTILLVEDEPFVREATCSILETLVLRFCRPGMRKMR